MTHPRRYAFSTQYHGSDKGAEWHKWDLHVHTPISVEQHYGDRQQADTWEKYLQALAALPTELQAIGINDYFTIDGYRQVLNAYEAGRLKNIQLLLPVVELRLAAFAGQSELSKLNFHVVFSNELSPGEIEEFFLRQLSVELCLDGSGPWRGCIGTAKGMEALGDAVIAATPSEKRHGESSMRVGFRSAAVTLDTVYDALSQSVFDGKYLTAIGVAEWTEMRWDGAGAAQKKDAIERADFVFTGSPSLEHYKRRLQQLQTSKVNSRLLDASDAHYYASSTEPNRLGQTSCWLKADLTFRGLRRALRRFDERVFIGDTPRKLERIRRQKTKYIKSIEIRRKAASTLEEKWFDTVLELNPDLVAIIGNQGSGKSALTDVLALCGDSKVEEFSFLNSSKFCDKKKRAAHFTATLIWEDGRKTSRDLNDRSDPLQAERVRYVPQGFFDSVTNEPGVSEKGLFYTEIKKTIFSHVPRAERQNCASFDDLVELHNHAAQDGLRQLREQLIELNRAIASLEAEIAPAEVRGVEALLKRNTEELAALVNNPPAAVIQPEKSRAASDAIDEIRVRENAAQGELDNLSVELSRLMRQRIALQGALQSVTNEEKRVARVVVKIRDDLDGVGIDLENTDLLVVTRDTSRVEVLLAEVVQQISIVQRKLDAADPSSVAAQLANLRASREVQERQLESAASAYQAYRTRHEAWSMEQARLRGDDAEPEPESAKGLEARLHAMRVTGLAELTTLEASRRVLCEQIYQAIAGLAETHLSLARPVQAHIGGDELIRDRYRLTFNVILGERNLGEQLFQCVNQQLGTFAGVQPGKEKLRSLVADADFTTASGAVEFAQNLLRQLKNNYKSEPPTPMEWAALLKKASCPEDVYNIIFSLEFLEPKFELSLNGKPLHQLSPGERGILLLVFYLVVDQGDEPLIIDQPEGNLNNQSIVDHLVPVFIRAKGNRQIIMVTHNPNLAVVCDAEQIIHCELNPDDGNRLTYSSGALENPQFNRISLDVLEGTKRAFSARHQTYDDVASGRPEK